MIFEDMVNDRDTLEDGNLTKNWYIKQSIAELGCGVFNLIGLGIGFVAYDVENDLQSFYNIKSSPLNLTDSTSLKYYLYWMLLISTILLCNYRLFHSIYKEFIRFFGYCEILCEITMVSKQENLTKR